MAFSTAKATSTHRIAFIAIIAAALCALLALAGCSAGENENASSSSSSAAESSSAETQAASEEPASGELGRVLVAYFSGSGNTRAVAEDIAADLDADIFEITPVEAYSEEDLDWTVDSSRVNVEHEDESLRVIELEQVTPDDFAEYDTVFLGYPIWWSIAAWPVDGFVSGNDFAGKTVIPFCTSTSSGLGDSAQLLEELTGTGTWLQGHRFPSSATAEEVSSWLETL